VLFLWEELGLRVSEKDIEEDIWTEVRGRDTRMKKTVA
jgi:hypothetical protein